MLLQQPTQHKRDIENFYICNRIYLLEQRQRSVLCSALPYLNSLILFILRYLKAVISKELLVLHVQCIVWCILMSFVVVREFCYILWQEWCEWGRRVSMHVLFLIVCKIHFKINTFSVYIFFFLSLHNTFDAIKTAAKINCNNYIYSRTRSYWHFWS